MASDVRDLARLGCVVLLVVREGGGDGELRPWRCILLGGRGGARSEDVIGEVVGCGLRVRGLRFEV